MKWIVTSLMILYNVAGVIAKDSVDASINISYRGMQAESDRLSIIAENLANANVTGLHPGQDPYQRKVAVLNNVYDEKLGATVPKVTSVRDKSPFDLRYEPNHPAADKNGLVKYPNVRIIAENIDSKEAQRTFEANTYALEISQANKKRIIDLMR